ATTTLSTLSLHDALPIFDHREHHAVRRGEQFGQFDAQPGEVVDVEKPAVVDFLGRDPPAGEAIGLRFEEAMQAAKAGRPAEPPGDRKSTRLNSSHLGISY